MREGPNMMPERSSPKRLTSRAVRRCATAAVLSTLVVILAACTDPPTIAYVKSVSILGGDRTLPQGTTVTLEAELIATGAIDTTVTWSSSNQAVVTINTNGTLTTHNQGVASIAAVSNADPTKNHSIIITVNPPGALRWTRQFGTSSDEGAYGIATDGNGNIYAIGTTGGALEETNTDVAGTFIRSYDSDGTLRWTRQFGTDSVDSARGIASDADGNVYVTGDTFGELGSPNAGGVDVFLRSYDSDGVLRWTRQFGGTGNDAFPDDYAAAVATDSNGNIFVLGYTYGELDGPIAGDGTAFIRSYDRNGELRWTRRFGATGSDAYADDDASAVATDANGNIYVTGRTYVGGYAGTASVFVRSFDPNGQHRWTRQFGTDYYDAGLSIATDTNGNVVATGYVNWTVNGYGDAFVRSYDSNGTLNWAHQFGTSGDERAAGIATGAYGRVYTFGTTDDALEGANRGGLDVFIRAYEP